MSDVKPLGHVVTFDELDYVKLRLAFRDAEAVIAAAQAEVNKAIGKRDAFMKQMAEKYEFDATCRTWQWDDDTWSFSFIKG